MTGPTLEFEHKFGYPSRTIAGVDEVGRGCLAGPVVGGAVILPERVSLDETPWVSDITDSKKLSEKSREYLAPLIRGWVRAWAVGSASHEEIDQINIHHASHLAMVRALDALSVRPEVVLVDGKFTPQAITVRSEAIVKGDLRSLSIACASILAKVHRDHLMINLETQYPGYGLAIHKGYPTPAHKRALATLGVSEIHRRSFKLI